SQCARYAIRLFYSLGSQKSVSSAAKMPGSDAHHDKPIPAYCKNKIPCLNSTNYSVEEIATKIMDIMGLNRRMY
ncbi:hypothetical protein ACSLOO_28125, partial [Klebsiella pneumoniae]